MEIRVPQKVSFDNGGEFIRETRREVELYLQSRWTRVRGYLQLYAKTVVAFGVMLASWVTLIFLSPGIWLGLLCLVGLAAGAILTAFCVQHDANHGAYFTKRRYNHLMGWTADALLGFSQLRLARQAQRRAPHLHERRRATTTTSPRSRSPGSCPSRRRGAGTGFQHYYIWPMYTLMVLRWQTVGDIAAFARGSIGRSPIRAPKRLGPRRSRGRQGDLHRLGARDPDASSIRGGACSPPMSPSR